MLENLLAHISPFKEIHLKSNELVDFLGNNKCMHGVMGLPIVLRISQ